MGIVRLGHEIVTVIPIIALEHGCDDRFGKTAAAAMLLSIDVRVFFWYLTLISCVAILLPQVPPYQVTYHTLTGWLI